MELTRSVEHCKATAGTSKRDTFNLITSFLDSSNVYGSDEYQGAEGIRLRSYVDGKLRVGSENSLPRESHCDIGDDIRAAEMPGLATMKTLFVREHNRIGDMLKTLPINWFELG